MGVAKNIGVDVVFGSRSKGFDVGLKGIQAKLNQMSAKARAVGQRMTVGMTLPILAVGAASLKASIDFNEGMANVATLIPGNIDRVNALKASVSDLAVSVGKDVGDLTGGLYQVISAFQDTADTEQLLTIAARSAVAGLSSTKEVIDLLSVVTSGYGDKSAAAAQQVADLAFTAVKLGRTTFPELAASMGRVVAQSTEMQVSQKELFAVFSTATSTSQAAEVSTQLRGVLQSLQAPTEQMIELFEKQEVASGKALLKQLGLKDTISLIVQEANRSNTPLQKYIGSIEGQTLALQLAGAQAGKFSDDLVAMNNVFGAQEKAYKEQTEGINKLGHDYKTLNQRIAQIARDIGDIMAPMMEKVNRALEKAVGLWSRLDRNTQVALVTLGGVAAAMGPLLIAMSLAIMLISPWAILALGILSVGAAGLVVMRNWSTIGPALTELMGAVFDTLLHIISDFNNSLPQILKAIVGNFDSTIGKGLFVALAGTWLLGGKRLAVALGAIRAVTAGALLLMSRLFVVGYVASAVYFLAKRWNEDHNGALTDTLNRMTDTIRDKLSGIDLSFKGLSDSSDSALSAFRESVNRHLGNVLADIRAWIETISSLSLGGAIKGLADQFMGGSSPAAPAPKAAPAPSLAPSVPVVPPAAQQSWKELDDTIKGTQQNIEALNQSMANSEVLNLFDSGVLARSHQVTQILDDVMSGLEKIKALNPAEGTREFFQEYKTRLTAQFTLFEQTWSQLVEVQELAGHGIVESTQATADKVMAIFNKLYNEIVASPKASKSSFFEEQVHDATVHLTSLKTFNAQTFQAMGQEVMGWGRTVASVTADTKESIAQELADVRAQMQALDAQESLTLPPIDTTAIDDALGHIREEGGAMKESVLQSSREMSAGLTTEIVGGTSPALQSLAEHVDRVKEKWDVLLQRMGDTAEGKAVMDMFNQIKTVLSEGEKAAEAVTAAAKNIPATINTALAQTTEATTQAVSLWDTLFGNFKFNMQTVFTDIRNAAVFTWGAIQTQFVSTMAGMIQGTTTFKEFMTQLWNTLLQAGLNTIISLGAQWVLSELVKTKATETATAASIVADKTRLIATTATEAARVGVITAANAAIARSALVSIGAITVVADATLAILAVVLGGVVGFMLAIAAAVAKVPIVGQVLAGTLIVGAASAKFAGLAAIAAAAGAVQVAAGTAVVALGKLSFGAGVPGLASGGIVTAPTLAMLGERGQKEAVMPLDKLDSYMTRPPQTLILEIDSRKLMEKLIPQFPKVVRMKLGAAL